MRHDVTKGCVNILYINLVRLKICGADGERTLYSASRAQGFFLSFLSPSHHCLCVALLLTPPNTHAHTQCMCVPLWDTLYTRTTRQHFLLNGNRITCQVPDLMHTQTHVIETSRDYIIISHTHFTIEWCFIIRRRFDGGVDFVLYCAITFFIPGSRRIFRSMIWQHRSYHTQLNWTRKAPKRFSCKCASFCEPHLRF